MENLDFDFLQIDNNVENQKIPGMERELYIYPLKSIFKENDKNKELLSYSPNVVNLKIIELDDCQKITAELIESTQFGYNSKQSIASLDNELVIVSKCDKTYSLDEKINYDPNKLYLVSEFEIKTDKDIITFGQLLQSYNIDRTNFELTNLFSNPLITTTSLEEWKPKDANSLVVKVGKQYSSFKVKQIDLTTPNAFLLESLNSFGANSLGEYGNASINSFESLYPLWLNPIDLQRNGKLRVLNYWCSNRILPISDVMKISRKYDNSDEIGKLLKFDDSSKNPIKTKKEENDIESLIITFDDITVINRFYLKGDALGPDEFRTKHISHQIEYKNNEQFPFVLRPMALESNKDAGITTEMKAAKYIPTLLNKMINFKFNPETLYGGIIGHSYDVKITKNMRISYTTNNSIDTSSLYELLLDVMTATFNYNNNFKGAGYKNNETKELNYMALYKQEFEGKTIREYIDGLESAWEKSNPEFVQTKQYDNYKKIRTMLSSETYGTFSIGGNKNSDDKFLLPYYFEIISKPKFKDKDNNIINESKKGDGIWKYDEIIVSCKSNYFSKDFKPLLPSLSEKKILNSNNDSFVWQNMNDIISETKLPSLSNGDLKTSDENVGKFLVYSKFDWTKVYGTSEEIIKNKAFFEKNQNIKEKYSFSLGEYNNSIKDITLTALYGSGKYDIHLVDENNKKIELNDINLFNPQQENIGLVKILL
ncbi:hypothetical protein [Mesoplasma lactucae]|uniref:Uncharacterized protein n=1 Tax=Mesoplasma lactucae ATCC 49193 TaxID=81460 RepID=A0A291IS38_9MOLU|nr:hypothetical protein [Mesoplasma lactucae]ATG97507.1 hypothetical protein CP520_01935 [Mesoplasma lactucae ATCC 49193]ATZ20037.1 hypothetical protein MLACT_v1c02150 [Mesoplasma lactucae ATCC 49193]MCL8217012.1 hypothetical protein [Mesoplasma lactucae ATCC 49193]